MYDGKWRSRWGVWWAVWHKKVFCYVINIVESVHVLDEYTSLRYK